MMMRGLCMVVAALAFAACGDDTTAGAGGGAAVSDSPLVGTWRQTTIEKRVAGEEWAPDTETCKLDDVEEYGADGSWALYDGTDLCGSGADVIRGTWRLVASDTRIIHTYDGVAGEYESTIESLTDSTFVRTHGAGDSAGTQYRSTYERQ